MRLPSGLVIPCPAHSNWPMVAIGSGSGRKARRDRRWRMTCSSEIVPVAAGGGNATGLP